MSRPPYKPFHHGPPRFQVALGQIEPGLWLSPDPEAGWLPEKNRRLDADPDKYYRGRPDAAAAEAEALMRVCEATGQQAPRRDEPDLIRAGRLVSDDLVVMQQLEAGWTATALLLAQPTFFSLEDSFDRELFALHTPVPGGVPGLATKIAKVFDRMPAGGVFERFNWTVQIGHERWWPHGSAMREQLDTQSPEDAARQLYLRVERQTLVRLEETGAVLFCIRICLDPLAEALADPADREAFARNWRAAGADALAYKRWGQFSAPVEAALKAMA
ncbi:MAG: hypothetical protein CMF74_00535 [Maricaulis sp.]|jgi:hypothetical protein|nr:hypothetical protein [Maricaulis sp.]HAQ34402.1 hypothetical protein [Alphaproteobacteria bacterium]